MEMSEVRAMYPQYDDLSDEELLRGVHAKHYSDTPFEDFLSRAGLAMAPEARELARYGGEAVDVLAELASSVNRSVTEVVDFLGPDTANAILSLAGSEKRVPTLTGALESTGIQGGYMEEGIARDAIQGLGKTLPLAAGLTPVTRNAASIKSVAADMLGFGSSSSRAASQSAEATKEMAEELALKRATGEKSTAKIMLDDAGKVVKDSLSKSVINQGFDEGVVAMVKAASPQTRQKFLNQLDIARKADNNTEYAAMNRPIQVLGDSILNRVKVLWESNRLARNRLDGVAKSLRGSQVDVAPAVDDFLTKIDDMGIKFDASTGNVDFRGSDLEGLDSAEKAVRGILKRMYDTDAPDAYDVHRLKRYIDNTVEYGTSEGGILGQVQSAVKGLRHDLDGLLDDTFPEYNRINTQYAETIGALDELQDVAGKKLNLHGDNAKSAIGNLSRRLLSNAQSGTNLLDALTLLDDTAQKYARSSSKELAPYREMLEKRKADLPDFSDGMIQQAIFADELANMFGTPARTSLAGEVEKATRSAMGGTGSMISDAAVGAAKKAAGVNNENAFKKMRELLERG